MKKLACILLMAVAVSGCSTAGRTYCQYPMAKAGWKVSWRDVGYGEKDATAEFPCSSYTYKLPGGIWVSDYHWFGPPFLPIFPPSFAGAGNPIDVGREIFLHMDGKHPDTFVCPVIQMYGKAYKGEGSINTPGDSKWCRYYIPRPKDPLTLFIEDQMGCKVPPLEFKLAPDWYYHPISPSNEY